jgi:hypothetical protein
MRSAPRSGRFDPTVIDEGGRFAPPSNSPDSSQLGDTTQCEGGDLNPYANYGASTSSRGGGAETTDFGSKAGSGGFCSETPCQGAVRLERPTLAVAASWVTLARPHALHASPWRPCQTVSPPQRWHRFRVG